MIYGSVEDALLSVQARLEEAESDEHLFLAHVNSYASLLAASVNEKLNHHRCYGSAENLHIAIDRTEMALAIMAEDNPRRAQLFYTLGLALKLRFEVQNNFQDVEDAVAAVRQGLQLVPCQDQSRPYMVRCFADMLHFRFEQTKQINDLDEAVKILGEAVKLTSRHEKEHVSGLHSLGLKYHARFKMTENAADLQQAIDEIKHAIEAASMLPVSAPAKGRLTSKTDLDKATPLSSLADCMFSAFKLSGKLDDIDAAICSLTEALEFTDQRFEHHPKRLENLAQGYLDRYFLSNDTNDLNRALSASMNAVVLTPKSDPNASPRLYLTGRIYFQRFEHSGLIQDLELAIAASTDAQTLLPIGSPMLPRYLDFLGVLLQNRYVRTSRIRFTLDIDKAIQMGTIAVEATPTNDDELAGRLINLGNAFHRRFHYEREKSDLDQAIQNDQEALRVFPKGRPLDKAFAIGNLSARLMERSHLTGKLEELGEAIWNMEQSLAAIPKNHPRYFAMIHNVGSCYQSLFDKTGAAADADRAVHYFLQAWKADDTRPVWRMGSAVRAFEIMAAIGDRKGALELYWEMVGSIPLFRNRALSRDDQQHMARLFSGTTSRACSLMLLEHSYDDRVVDQALQVLESGRGAIAGILMDDALDLANLSEAHPKVAEKLLHLEALSKASRSTGVGGVIRVDESGLAAYGNFHAHVQAIRELPNFEDFWLDKAIGSPTVAQLQVTALEGAIVMVNASKISSEAFVITTTSATVLPLPLMNFDHIENWSEQHLTLFSKRSELEVKNPRFQEHLSWLWDVCVQPILKHLSYQPSDDPGTLPRIWWIGNGAAQSLSFHAAGNHAPGSSQNTMSHAISSYMPTARALLFAHRDTRLPGTSESDQKPKLLVTSMTNTPGYDPLPGTQLEVEVIESITKSRAEVLTLFQPNVSDCLANIRGKDIVHFACHGTSNSLDPSESCLVLTKLDPTPQQDCLTATAISQVRLSRTRIAFLSACSTAQTETVTDEAVHVASAFQIAGFTHVIGCMWATKDSVSRDTAGAFYTALMQKEWVKTTNRDIAVSMHKAVLSVMRQGRSWKKPLLWAQYMHFGL